MNFSLKTVLAVYFIPTAVLPVLFLSLYASRVFEESTEEALNKRVLLERDGILAEMERLEDSLRLAARNHANMALFKSAARDRNPSGLEDFFRSVSSNVSFRFYAEIGPPLVSSYAPGREGAVAYLSKEGWHAVGGGESQRLYFSSEPAGIVILTRCLVKTGGVVVGVLEEEYFLGNRELAEIKHRRHVDVVFLSRDLRQLVSSLAIPKDVLKSVSEMSFKSTTAERKSPLIVEFDKNRFASFLFDLSSRELKQEPWGYLALFLSMTGVESSANRLKIAMVYLTLGLVLVAALLIFVFSNRVVRPIKRLVLAMKRIKSGRVEWLEGMDSPYEIEYLVRSFNEMARNISMAKHALELKVEELRRANMEIKNTQSHLVQSAKMISLGQLVAGVAHELNNPIGFIYSNMHHLSEYIEKIKELLEAYRDLHEALPPHLRAEMEKKIREMEIDFILKDVEELTKSCQEGAQRTKDIVMGLRTFSRMDEAECKLSDIHESLKGTIKLLVTEFKDKVTIHEEYQELPLVECNPSQMNQVFMNLLSNAAQAIERLGDIWIRTRLEKGMAVIEVEDNGIGIAKESMEKIFDPFFTTKKVGQGTGLGLSISYGLIQKHNGLISVKSKVGVGTCFTVSLPFRQPTRTEKTNAA